MSDNPNYPSQTLTKEELLIVMRMGQEIADTIVEVTPGPIHGIYAAFYAAAFMSIISRDPSKDIDGILDNLCVGFKAAYKNADAFVKETVQLNESSDQDRSSSEDNSSIH